MTSEKHHRAAKRRLFPVGRGMTSLVVFMVPGNSHLPLMLSPGMLLCFHVDSHKHTQAARRLKVAIRSNTQDYSGKMLMIERLYLGISHMCETNFATPNKN